jgi:hypothetical protein
VLRRPQTREAAPHQRVTLLAKRRTLGSDSSKRNRHQSLTMAEQRILLRLSWRIVKNIVAECQDSLEMSYPLINSSEMFPSFN